MTNEEKEKALKIRFAEFALRNPDDLYRAAVLTCNGNSQLAMQIFNAWGASHEIEVLKQELIAERGHESFLPTREETLVDLYRRAARCYDNKEYVGIVKLIADIRGMIEKPGFNITNNITTNKVMNIPILVDRRGETLDDDEWEKRLIEQQETLIEK